PGPPPVRPPRGASRGHVAAVDHGLQRLASLFRRLARHRRQALDERPELVLAEEADDGVAVVVPEPGRLEVDRDREVAHDPGELATHEDLVDVLAELLAELRRADLVEPGEERVEVAKVPD